MQSPYRPGFGVRPTVLVGREAVLARAAAELTRVANSGSAAPSVTVFTGPRGLGKTVTLDAIASIAVERRFLRCWLALDSVSDNIQLLATRAAEAVAPLEGRGGGLWETFRARLGSLALELNAGVVKIASEQPKQRRRPTVERQVLGDLLARTARLAVEHSKTGLAIFLDELQEAPHEQLVVLCNAIQDLLTAQPAPPVILFAAGLPTTVDRVIAAASFAERFDFHQITRFNDLDAERALVEPALALGVKWEVDAARTALLNAAGSPYLIQKIGDEAWLIADPRPDNPVTLADVGQAVLNVRAGLDAGMFRGRWVKATPVEQAVLVAMAQVADADGVALTRDITTVTGKTTPQLSTTRKSLIDKGIIEAAGKGRWRFTMPGFADYLQGQTEAAEAALPPGQDDVRTLGADESGL